MNRNANRFALLSLAVAGVGLYSGIATAVPVVPQTHDATPWQSVLADPEGDPVPADKLPKAVVDAVKQKLPGCRIDKALKTKDGNYFLDDVKVGKKEYDVYVTPEGKITKCEEQKDND